MFDALVNGRIDCGELTFEVAYYDIEELNRRAEAGEADVSKISYALLPEIQSRYTLLDSGSALGRGNGPVFVARQGTPPDSIRRSRKKSRCSSRKSHPPWHAGSTTPGCWSTKAASSIENWAWS